MAEKFDLNQFYENTRITIPNLQELDFRSIKADTEGKSYKIYTANLAFGMLAQLNVTSNEQTPYIGGRLHLAGITDGNYQLLFLKSLKRLKIYHNYKLNPSAAAMIQRYRALFGSYEKQRGIQNPFTEDRNVTHT